MLKSPFSQISDYIYTELHKRCYTDEELEAMCYADAYSLLGDIMEAEAKGHQMLLDHKEAEKKRFQEESKYYE